MVNISTGLIGWWKFDESAGNTATDSSGNENAGIINNAPTFVLGKFGNSIQFNGVNQYVMMGSNLYPGTQGLTLSCWFKTSSNQSQGLIGKTVYGDYVGRYGIYFDSGTINVLIQGTSGRPQITVAKNYYDNQWHNIVATFDRIGNLVLYYDNIVIGSIDISYMNGQDIKGDNNFFIGAYGNSSGSSYQGGTCFNGLIDEVRVYTVALSQENVTALFNNVQPIILPKLSTPIISNLLGSSAAFSVSWSTVLNAIWYLVSLYKDGILINTYNITDTSYLFSLLYSGNYNISIIAVGDGINYNNANPVNSNTVAVNGLFTGCPILNFMGFSAIVSPPAKLNFMGFSVEKSVKLSYLNFWGFSAVDAPESFLFYQIN